MSDENEENSIDENSIDRIASTRSVNAALDLLRGAARKTTKRKRNEKPDKREKFLPFCLTNLVDGKESNAALGFSENHAMMEMRNCIARHDWSSLRELFPLLLGCYRGMEPVTWRYAMALLLCSPNSDSLYFQEFLELCIGTQTHEDSNLLERLLTLQHTNS